MGEVIKEALIIEANGLMVKAFVVENLPKNLLYYKTKKLMPIEDFSERLVPCFTIDEHGRKNPTGEMVDALNPGITMDGAGSGGFIFDLFSDDSITALKKIDEHIHNTIKDVELRPARQPYAQVWMDKASYPKPYNQIIRVRLPEAVSPPVVPTTEQLTVAVPVAKVRKPMTEEQREAARARMAAARAKKASKIV
jgi:hypothetical protein